MSLLTQGHIAWRDSVETARQEAHHTSKLVFIELFSPKCIGCQNMEARTFSDERVIDLLELEFVPTHYDVLNEPDHLKEFIAGWTPTLIWQCPDGNEHRRSVGFLTPEKFIGESHLARVLYALHRQSFDEMHRIAQQAVEVTEGDLVRHPEALYWQAVAAYKASENQDLLIQGWKDLLARYPASDWAGRVDFVNGL